MNQRPLLYVVITRAMQIVRVMGCGVRSLNYYAPYI
jgi:hypothetical protein